ncbi:MAG: PKD domain-containing protein [Desulfatibacillaceae bacterium]
MKGLRVIGWVLTVLVAVALGVHGAWAKIPEPDVIFTGNATLRGGVSQATEEITLVLENPEEQVDSYVPGSNAAYGGRYVLRAPMWADASNQGRVASFYIGSTLAGRMAVPAKGKVVNLDLDTLYGRDNDGDGMDDSWEMRHFGTLDRDGTGDANGDGVTDLDEFRAGTNPVAPQWNQVDEDVLQACVSNVLVLRQALADAGSDGMHNEIHVQEGTYAGSYAYTAALDENHDLTLVGGYGADCETRTYDPGLTVLSGDTTGDGRGDVSILEINTADAEVMGTVRIEGFLFHRGGTDTLVGGGIRVRNAVADIGIVGNRFEYCYGADGGGVAITTRSGNLLVANNTFRNNVATNKGAGLYLWVEGSSAHTRIGNNTFYWNNAPYGAGIYLYAPASTPEVRNNIFSTNKGGWALYYPATNLPDFDYNLLWNNQQGWSNKTLSPENNIQANPMFLDASAGDFSYTQTAPAVDAGANVDWLPGVDQVGSTRIMDGDGDNVYRVDAGSWEYAGGIPDCDATTDMDCDGVPDTMDQAQGLDDTVDSDKDGFSDGQELSCGSDPDDPASMPLPPVAVAWASSTVTPGAEATLNGANSFAYDPDSIAMSWTQVSGPAVSLEYTNTMNTHFTAPMVANPTALMFELAVADNCQQSLDYCVVNVCNGGTPPTAEAGDDQAVMQGAFVTLDASGSTGTAPLSYDWTQLSGPSAVLNEAGSQCTFTAPAEDGAMVLLVTVTDADGLVALDRVVVNVSDTGQPPVANAGADFNAWEYSTATLDGTASADSDSPTLVRYSWRQVAGAPLGLGNPWSATTTFVAPGVGPAGSTLGFELWVWDGEKLVHSDAVNVMVQDTGIEAGGSDAVSFTATTGHIMVARPTNGGCVITQVGAVDPNTVITLLNRPEGFVYGLVQIQARVARPGDTAEIRIVMPSPAPAGATWWKYGQKAGWVDFDRDLISGGTGDGAVFSADRKTVTLYITDNGPYDDDPIDSIVLDPSGLAGPPAGGGGAGGGSGTAGGPVSSGGGSCFVRSVSGNGIAWPVAVVLALAALAALYGRRVRMEAANR